MSTAEVLICPEGRPPPEHVETVEVPHAPRPRRWTSEEFRCFAEAGVFDPQERLELIEGEIYRMSPQSRRHVLVVHRVRRALEAVFGAGHLILTHSPLHASPGSVPEPDVSVLEVSEEAYLSRDRDDALLVVEVSETSLRFDRTRKAPLYAQSGIPEYWVVNLIEKVVEVYTDPDPANAEYRSIRLLRAGDVLVPRAAPDAEIPVADLLP